MNTLGTLDALEYCIDYAMRRAKCSRQERDAILGDRRGAIEPGRPSVSDLRAVVAMVAREKHRADFGFVPSWPDLAEAMLRPTHSTLLMAVGRMESRERCRECLLPVCVCEGVFL